MKYRLKDEMIASFVNNVRKELVSQDIVLPSSYQQLSDQELAVWYNDNVIYPDKVRLNKFYYEHYSFLKDIDMIFATVLDLKVKFNGKLI